MASYEDTAQYNTEVQAFQYRHDGSIQTVEPFITDAEQAAMDYAIELGELALRDNNPPVGAVLIVDDGLHTFGAKTHDKTSRKLNGHGEIIAYEDAHAVVGDDLSHSTLVSTAVLCSSCTPPYAEGKIGKIITAAPRRYVWQLSGIMRPRHINMHELLVDGDTDTVSIINYGLERALGMFAEYGRLRRHAIPHDVDEFLLPFVESRRPFDEHQADLW